MEKLELRTTRDQVEEFKESILWADIVQELNFWKEGFSIEQDLIVDEAAEKNQSTASVLLHIGDLNGRKKAVDFMLDILDMFLSMMETKVEDKKDGRNKTD